MNKKISIVVGIIIVIFAIYLISKDNTDVDEINIDRNESNFVEKVAVQHKYENGKHTMYGVVSAPTPCHEVDISSAISGDDATIDITLEESGDMCAQVIADKPFIYSFAGEEDLNLLGTLNGEVIEFNITELEEGGEFDLEDFMFKG